MSSTLTKKIVRRQSCDLSFIWEQMDDGSPGDSTSDGCEGLLQISLGYSKEAAGARSGYMIFLVKGGIVQSGTYFLQRFSTSLLELLFVARNSRHHAECLCFSI